MTTKMGKIIKRGVVRSYFVVAYDASGHYLALALNLQSKLWSNIPSVTSSNHLHMSEVLDLRLLNTGLRHCQVPSARETKGAARHNEEAGEGTRWTWQEAFERQ